MVEAAAQIQQRRRDGSTSIIATCSRREENRGEATPDAGAFWQQSYSLRSYDPLGGFFPRVATKLTQSP
jgi:hypothetical protein